MKAPDIPVSQTSVSDVPVIDGGRRNLSDFRDGKGRHLLSGIENQRPEGKGCSAPAASAARVISTRASGLCSAGSHWTIKAKPDNGNLGVEPRIDSNRVGQLWTVRITDNRQLVTATTNATLAPSGAFTVRSLTTNRPGVDHIMAVARVFLSGNGIGGPS